MNVKWNKSSYDVDVEPSEGLETFQAALFSLTNVPADRQKLMCKGKLLRSDADIAALTADSKVMLMGTADAMAAGPAKQVLFEEDLTEKDRVKLAPSTITSAGLVNMGNSCQSCTHACSPCTSRDNHAQARTSTHSHCSSIILCPACLLHLGYLASTLQAFRAVPELKQALIRYGSAAQSERDPEAIVTSNLGKLMLELDHSASAITPMLFITVFRSSFAQFAERNSEGAWAQQDADECLQTLMQAMAHKLGPYSGADTSFLQPSNASSSPPGMIDAIFGGQLSTIVKCAESAEEPVRRSTETFRKLRCHIDQKIAFLSEGLAADMLGEQEMRSATLGRSAVWHKRSVITALPNYLIVQFVRFDWKKDTQKKAKVLKKVEFPLRLDVADLCGSALKRSLLAARRALKDEDDKKRGLTSLNRTRNMAAIKQTAKERQGKEEEKKEAAAAAGSASGSSSSSSNVALSVDDEEVSSDVLQPTSSSGYYDLLSVITHKGRYADSGHYIGWSRSEPSSDNWSAKQSHQHIAALIHAPSAPRLVCEHHLYTFLTVLPPPSLLVYYTVLCALCSGGSTTTTW